MEGYYYLLILLYAVLVVKVSSFESLSNSYSKKHYRKFSERFDEKFLSTFGNGKSTVRRISGVVALTARLDRAIPFDEYSRLGKQITDVKIEAPSINTRRITASILIDSTMESVWSVLTDYNNLATHVPNLVKSNLVASPPGTIRLFQEGAQKIIGFDFRASLTMDMTEEREQTNTENNTWKVGFQLVDSKMFNAFDGVWLLRYHSRIPITDPKTKQTTFKYRSQLTYSVFIRPRGPVPVFALEWRIREDVPVNLFALKVAAEKIDEDQSRRLQGNNGYLNDTSNGFDSSATDRISYPIYNQNRWYSDETLEIYLNRIAQ